MMESVSRDLLAYARMEAGSQVRASSRDLALDGNARGVEPHLEKSSQDRSPLHVPRMWRAPGAAQILGVLRTATCQDRRISESTTSEAQEERRLCSRNEEDNRS